MIRVSIPRFIIYWFILHHVSSVLLFSLLSGVLPQAALYFSCTFTGVCARLFSHPVQSRRQKLSIPLCWLCSLFGAAQKKSIFFFREKNNLWLWSVGLLLEYITPYLLYATLSCLSPFFAPFFVLFLRFTFNVSHNFRFVK